MTVSRVWIRYKPQLYHELLKKLFCSQRAVEVLETYQLFAGSVDREGFRGRFVDVILLPLDDQGRPELELLPFPISQAKLIAFSPKGDHGMRRKPGESSWEELQPCGIAQVLQEVLTP